MRSCMDPAVLLALWERIDDRDWDAMAGLLHPDARIEFVHTGEVFDRAGWVALNREYPGRWRGRVVDLVACGDVRSIAPR